MPDTAAASEVLLVFVTAPPDAAERLARMLVDARLAACVNVLPAMCSVYRWAGAVETAEENQLLIKTTRRRYAALQEAVRQAHPYDLPEIFAIDTATGLPEYLQWVHEQTA